MEYNQYLFLFLLLALNGFTTVNASLSCPERECQSVEQPKIYPPKMGCNSNDLSFESLFNYTTDEGKVLVELLGPVDAIDSVAIVITAPHGGSEKLTNMEIPPRKCSGCKTYKDSYTLEIAMELGYGLIDNYCKVPYIVVNYLHRSKLDANREIVEAAQGNAIAEEAWKAFHDFTAQAQLLVASQHGYVTASGLQGVKGLLFDVHGYSGKDWVPNVGSPFIQWGYRLSENTLDPNTWCPVDERSSGTIGSFSHARNLPGQSLECLVRGPSSLGSRINGLLPITGTVDSGDIHCGIGLPSLEFPSPKSTANNPAYCAKAKENPSDDCHYYSGGFDINVHEKIDWDKSFAPNNAMMMNAVQAEFPRCLRFASGQNSRNKVHRNLANVLAEGICGFMLDLYDESALC